VGLPNEDFGTFQGLKRIDSNVDDDLHAAVAIPDAAPEEDGFPQQPTRALSALLPDLLPESRNRRSNARLVDFVEDLLDAPLG
jgi:hypothetical protein